MIRQAVGAIVIQGQEVLLVHKVKMSVINNRNIEGEWDFPKGGVESYDRDLETALLRELAEETGSTQYRIKAQLEGKISFPFNEEIKSKTGFEEQVTTMFVVEYYGDRNDLMPDDIEINGMEFVKYENVYEKLAHKEAKELYLEYIKKLRIECDLDE